MIEFLIFVVAAIIGFVIGALVYRNNSDEWKEKSDILEAQFDAEVASASKEILKLRAKIKELTKE